MSPLHPLALHLPQSKSTVTQPLRWTAAAKLPPPIHGLGWTFGQRRVAPFLFNLCTFNYFQKWNQHDPDFFRWIDWLGGIIMDKWNDYKTWLYKPFICAYWVQIVNLFFCLVSNLRSNKSKILIHDNFSPNHALLLLHGIAIGWNHPLLLLRGNWCVCKLLCKSSDKVTHVAALLLCSCAKVTHVAAREVGLSL